MYGLLIVVVVAAAAAAAVDLGGNDSNSTNVLFIAGVTCHM